MSAASDPSHHRKPVGETGDRKKPREFRARNDIRSNWRPTPAGAFTSIEVVGIRG